MPKVFFGDGGGKYWMDTRMGLGQLGSAIVCEVIGIWVMGYNKKNGGCNKIGETIKYCDKSNQ